MSSKIPKILQDISKLISGSIVSKIIGLFVLAFYARVLSKEEMAVFPVYMMLSGLASLLFSFGIMPNMIKQLPTMFKSNIDEARRLIFTSGAIILLGTVLVSGFVYHFSLFIDDLLLDGKMQPILIQIMTVGFISLSISNVAEQILWASGRFGAKSVLVVSESLIRPCFTISLFLFFGVKGLVAGLVLAQSVKAALALYCCKDILLGKFPGFFSPTRLLRLSLPFYLESYLMYFRREGDSWLVSTLLGPASLSTYYIAKTIYNSFRMLYSSVDQVITRKLAGLKDNIELLWNKVRDIHMVISLFSIPLVFLAITLLPLAINIIAGDKYKNAFLPAMFLLLALLVDFQRISISRSIFVCLSPMARFKVTVVDTVILLPVLFLLGWKFNCPGVAAARFVSQFLGGVYGYMFLSRKTSFSLEYKQVVILLMACLTALFGVYMLYYFIDAPNNLIFARMLIAPAWLIIAVIIFLIIARITGESLSTLLRTDLVPLFGKRK